MNTKHMSARQQRATQKTIELSIRLARLFKLDDPEIGIIQATKGSPELRDLKYRESVAALLEKIVDKAQAEALGRVEQAIDTHSFLERLAKVDGVGPKLLERIREHFLHPAEETDGHTD